MCIPTPAQVVTCLHGGVVVADGGRQLRLDCPVPAGLQSGDWVLIAFGQIINRLSPEEAASLRELHSVWLAGDFSGGCEADEPPTPT